MYLYVSVTVSLFRYLVYETGAQGIVVASMLERMGSHGSLTHIYQTGPNSPLIIMLSV